MPGRPVPRGVGVTRVLGGVVGDGVVVGWDCGEPLEEQPARSAVVRVRARVKLRVTRCPIERMGSSCSGQVAQPD
jgi:hypothetical protein